MWPTTLALGLLMSLPAQAAPGAGATVSRPSAPRPTARPAPSSRPVARPTSSPRPVTRPSSAPSPRPSSSSPSPRTSSPSARPLSGTEPRPSPAPVRPATPEAPSTGLPQIRGPGEALYWEALLADPQVAGLGQFQGNLLSDQTVDAPSGTVPSAPTGYVSAPTAGGDLHCPAPTGLSAPAGLSPYQPAQYALVTAPRPAAAGASTTSEQVAPSAPARGRWGAGLGLALLHSAYKGSEGSWTGNWTDPGMALDLSYRATPLFSGEVVLAGYFDPQQERRHALAQASARVHAQTGDEGLSPYLAAGFTWMQRSVVDDYWDGTDPTHYETARPGYGPHVGLGIEIALATSWYIDLDVRSVFDVSRGGGAALPFALQTGFALARRF